MATGTPTLRVGTLGAAAITPAALVTPVRAVPRAELVAVAARDRDRAEAFASKHGIPRVHGSYDELLADPDVDAVYNPLPNGLHAEWTIAALEAGKHVLCEKPFTSNADEARHVAAVAGRTGLVVMEAFHYRYHPLMRRAVELCRSGGLGELRRVDAWMQAPLFKPGDIRFRHELAGGAQMDLGAYTTHQVRTLTGREPEVVSARARRHSARVDRWMRAELRFADGTTSRTTVSLYGAVPVRLGFHVVGTEGELKVMNPTLPSMYSRFTVRVGDRRRRERFPRTPTYTYQLEAFAAAVLDGAAVLTPPEDSIANMEAIDAIYEAAGLGPRG
jgi:predicted dehydrogenase